MKPLPVFLKWPGGKRQSLGPIEQALCGDGPPTGWCYDEPFLGSGFVFLQLAMAGRLTSARLADLNPKLIQLWTTVKEAPEDIVEALSHLPVTPGWSDHYTDLRTAFNHSPRVLTPDPAQAARFLWLNRACFNGLYRENRRGDFNVPVGRYDTLSLPTLDTLREASRLLRSVDLVLDCGLFHAPRPSLPPLTHLYLDPPYVPHSATASFTTYAGRPFVDLDQRMLATWAADHRDQGVRVVASNSDTPEARAIWEERGFGSTPLQVRRSISCTTSHRAPVGERLFTSSPLSPPSEPTPP